MRVVQWPRGWPESIRLVTCGYLPYASEEAEMGRAVCRTRFPRIDAISPLFLDDGSRYGSKAGNADRAVL